MNQSRWTSKIKDFVEKKLQRKNFPGLALAVTDREGVLYSEAFGFADLRGRREARLEDLFEIGSIGKSFTALLLLQLKDEGELDLHEPVERYLPWFEAVSSPDPIEIHHLLTHTAGVIRGTEISPEDRYQVWLLREMEATTPPGEFFHYSNTGYKALGSLLKRVTGKGYGELVRERILEPLGMEETEPTINNEIREKLAPGHTPYYDDRPLPPQGRLAPATWMETATADGCIASTAEDMSRYLRLLLGRGKFEGKRLISEKSFSLLTQKAIETPGLMRGDYYGYGLEIWGKDRGDGLRIGHGGGMVGYSARILADMEAGRAAVALSNGPRDPSPMAEYALKLALAGAEGGKLPPAPKESEKGKGVSAYTGRYRQVDGDRSLQLEEGRGGTLLSTEGKEPEKLSRLGEDEFYLDLPPFHLFPLRFQLEEGEAIAAVNGPRLFLKEGGKGRSREASGWEVYRGHYRSYSPWETNFRVLSRGGKLLLIHPAGEEEELVELGGGLFRVGSDPRSPERMEFDTLIDGRATRAVFSGTPYYRVPTE